MCACERAVREREQEQGKRLLNGNARTVNKRAIVKQSTEQDNQFHKCTAHTSSVTSLVLCLRLLFACQSSV